MGRSAVCDQAGLVRFYLERFSDDALNVHTIHAETEGMGHFDAFTAVVPALKERGARFVRVFFIVVVSAFIVRIGGEVLGLWG